MLLNSSSTPVSYPFCDKLRLGGFLEMPAEFVAHGREHPVRKIRLAARAEPFIKGRRQHMGRDPFIDGGLDRPPALAGVGHAARELRQGGVLDQGGGG